MEEKPPIKGKEPQLNAQLLLLQLHQDVITVLAHSTDRNPGDPQALEALRRIDANRKLLEKSVGQDVTDIVDPHGRLLADSGKKEGAK